MWMDYLRGILKIVDAQSTKDTTISSTDSKDILLTSTPVKDFSSDNNFILDSNNSCPACKNNDKPSGGHVCHLCKKYVHALPQCSLPFGDVEEGYSQSRICTLCKDNMQNMKDILTKREVENWRGLGQVKSNKSDALYLGKNPHKIIDSLKCKKAAKISIMKNGNDISLKSLKIHNDNYTVSNTCAFDNIFQILLVAGHDFHHILKHIEETSLFFKLIVHTIKNGISQYIYKLRAQILLDIFPISNIGGCKYIDCETNVGYLAGILFKETPSFKETS